MDFERPPTVFLILLPIMLSYQSPLCPMCTQHLWDSSDHVGALSRSSNETVDSEDMDSVSLGILLEKPYDFVWILKRPPTASCLDCCVLNTLLLLKHLQLKHSAQAPEECWFSQPLCYICGATLQHDVLSMNNKLNSFLWSAMRCKHLL